MAGSRSSWGRRVPPALFGGLVALLLLIAATGGPDCLQYLDWSRAAKSGEIGELPGDLRTPAGLPLTQWSHGPGMFFALPYLSPTRHLVSDGPLAPVRDFRFMGWLAALALWGGLLGVLRRVAHDDTPIVLFVAAAAFAGTHLGFYSFVHSSEILTFGCLALIAYRLVVRVPLGPIDLLGIGALTASLVLIRPHLLIYLPLILGVTVWRLDRQRLIGSGKRRVLQTALIAGPILLALAQVLWVNRWMTGSLLHSTYTFGEGTFRSLDLVRPELLAVLVHPWHGLLAYHPLYALAFALVVAGIFRGSRPARLLHLGIAVTLLTHLYVQAAWYCWWLGLWSLGNRGLGVGAVLLVPVLARALWEARASRRVALTLAVTACALWSVTLMIQGHTNFVRWSELLAAQVSALRDLAPVLPVALGVSLAAFLLGRRRETSVRVLYAATSLFVALILDHLALRVAEVVSGGTEPRWALVFRICVAAVAPVTVLFALPRTESRGETTRPALRLALAAVALGLFVWSGGLFLRLAIRTEKLLAAGGLERGGRVASFQYTEVKECYREYLRVPGFEDKKSSLRRFLEQNDPG